MYIHNGVQLDIALKIQTTVQHPCNAHAVTVRGHNSDYPTPWVSEYR